MEDVVVGCVVLMFVLIIACGIVVVVLSFIMGG